MWHFENLCFVSIRAPVLSSKLTNHNSKFTPPESIPQGHHRQSDRCSEHCEVCEKTCFLRLSGEGDLLAGLSTRHERVSRTEPMTSPLEMLKYKVQINIQQRDNSSFVRTSTAFIKSPWSVVLSKSTSSAHWFCPLKSSFWRGWTFRRWSSLRNFRAVWNFKKYFPNSQLADRLRFSITLPPEGRRKFWVLSVILLSDGGR